MSGSCSRCHSVLDKFYRCLNVHCALYLVSTRPAEILDLTELMFTQARLQARMGEPTGVGEAGLKENLLHVMVEAIEAMAETNFKPWKTTRKAVDRQALATELTDILQFWANAANAMGFTPEELTQALRAKWQVNYDRIDNGEVVENIKAARKMLDEKDVPTTGRKLWKDGDIMEGGK